MLPAPNERADPWCAVAALVLVVAWFALNMRYSAQNLYATRDPATYNIAARWLMDNPSLHISIHPEIFGTPAGTPPSRRASPSA